MSADRVRAYIALGANLGDSAATLKTVLDELRQTPGIAAVTASRFYRTAPVEATGPDFVNAAAAGHHAGAAGTAGRAAGPGTAPRPRAPYKNAPRTLDLDMLLHGDQSLEDQRLVLPHPRMHLRAFVLRPLLDLAPPCASPAARPPTGWPTSTTSPSPRCKGAARQPPPHPDIQARHHARPHTGLPNRGRTVPARPVRSGALLKREARSARGPSI